MHTTTLEEYSTLVVRVLQLVCIRDRTYLELLVCILLVHTCECMDSTHNNNIIITITST